MIRISSKDDIAQINDLGKELNNNFENLYDIQKNLNSSLNEKIYVYEINNQITGFLHFIELEEEIDIINIIVKKKYRKKGIATALFNYMFDNMSKTVKSITLEVSVDNDNAIYLYKKLGFKVVNIRKEYYSGIDAYLMRKEV